jgi:lipopolysaccharide biosynthesis glycosyltransferase
MFNIFINFKPDNTKAYGGGNITTYYVQKFFQNKYNNFIVKYELCNPIDIYLIIDPFKDNNFKKYNLEDVIDHRNKNNKNGKIIVRINDSDITRPNLQIELSREKKIIKYSNEINYFICNSNFIRNHYKKFIDINQSEIIYNGCDTSIFYPKPISINKREKFKIVTHHWSNNMNKGYQMYYDLWTYLVRSNKYEFIFIGKNIPEMFKEVPIIGPYVGMDLSNAIRDCQIYITDSIYDSCPNHVIEAISCGLPILYRDHEGGARELCELFPKKIGESYSNLEELIEKIVLIRKNYNDYRANVIEYSNYFSINKQISKYSDIFLNNLLPNKFKIGEIFVKNSYSITLKISSTINSIYLYLENRYINIIPGNIYHINCILEKQDIYLYTNLNKKINIDIELFNCDLFSNSNKLKLNNNKLNILYSSDKSYFTPMFASLHSVIKNSDEKLDELHFNFFIPIEDANYFQNIIKKYRESLNYTIVLIDKIILDQEILNSKCYDGGNHLLNIGNFSRLLIGEVFSYSKLLYLDSDSICKMNVNKLININIDNKFYCFKADKKNAYNKRSLLLKLSSIISEEYSKNNNINLEDFAYYGAPFLTDCNIWKDTYSKIIEIVSQHNKSEKGIYKLFTMSLQNIIFYGKMEDIYTIIRTLPDLGSNRKEWLKEDLDNADILDWSGIYKPWFSNGLYKEEWEKYNVIPFLEDFGEIQFAKKTVEKFII